MKRGVLILALASFLPAAPALAQTPRTISAVAPAPVYKGKQLYSNSWAVIIGINRYQHPRIPELRYARKDAEDIRKVLPRLGFPTSQILTLFGRKATKQNIESLLGDQLRRRVSPNDRVFVFFAGHGMDEDEEGYLIPHDADPERLFSTAISMQNLALMAKRMRARHVLFAVDACYSGYAIYRTRKIVNPELVTDLTSRTAVQVITAGRKGEVAQEREGNGLFTQVLLKGLAGAADRRGWGWLSLEHLGEYVRDRVYAESQKQQYPQFGNLSGDGQFVFVLPGTRADGEAERLRQERAKLQEERRKLEAEKERLERERLVAEKARIEAERKRLEAERRRIEEERKRLARARTLSVPTQVDREAYGKALSLLKEGRLQEARRGFQDLLRRFPTSPLADDAQYGIGETYYQERRINKAILAYDRVVINYAKGDKVPAALLKEGIAFLALGDKASAKQLWTQLVKEYPDSEEAMKAKSWLSSL